ncbi:hypothetical protein CIK99_12935 [Prevotella sp. P5-92]|uniref:TetR/AcrR family transcriptional regulator n=1 Tax=Prevotella sp. P5-92 TaxID=2024222 RepID=UPI000B972500|nr:TetR/AcrR family transcriptional regulator [Prevotella sp. P5-92]OYP54425.1 hypothetical protein CIK99_12935 [Prevotella sp. P5-92]
MKMNVIRYNTSYRRSLKQKILTTAASLFAKHGIKAVKMDDISNELSISKRTLYEIYDNKELLLFECVKTRLEESERKTIEAVEKSENVMDLLIRIYRLRMEALRQTHPLFYVELTKYPDVLEYLQSKDEEKRKHNMEFVERGIREGYFRTDVDYPLVLELFDASNRYVLDHYETLGTALDRVLYNLIFVFLRGFCTKEGIEILDRFLEENEEMRMLRR